MIVNTNQITSITEANQNFSKVAKIADKSGSAVIFKNNKAKYLVLNVEENPYIELTDDEKIDIIARRVLEKYRKDFEELAK
ncbi:MAG: type II toxin-antitoxin system Phd/YefM family antitoxin [Clostridia bacterium]|jgi:antitoxin Phd|nr:type II toxin-antitoxin system Phd/YefM family antitoxin [Clostridia bacterium]MCX4367157.1 type II toxin-antitoxin system Phd/YefM family antitoxin [Clostridia bacterium]